MKVLLTAMLAAGVVLAVACGSSSNKTSNSVPSVPPGGGLTQTAASPTQASAGAQPSQAACPTAAVAPTPAAPPDNSKVSDGNAPGIPPLTGTIVTTADGLRYIDQQVGTGATPQKGQTVTVNYTGWLTNGLKFDSSVDRCQPFGFTLGAGQVIRGWDEGLSTMKVGGKRRLIIPSTLGYGASGAPPTIPGGATLIFDVDLLSAQ